MDGGYIYVFVTEDPREIVKLEQEFTNDFTVSATEFLKATKIVWGAQAKLRRLEYGAREQD